MTLKWSTLFSNTFSSMSRELGLAWSYAGDRHPESLIAASRANDSDFCLEMTGRYGITESQMLHAADRYMLGKSKSGKCIFWMVDERGCVRDGHFADSWVSQQLKCRYPDLAQYIRPRHCLFGLHLLRNGKAKNDNPVAIVESERSAVVLSEIYPESLWLATCYPMNLTVEHLQPLCGHPVTLFPPTDETMDTYLAWLDIADLARREHPLNVTVSSVLEDSCSPAQKSAKIDIVDFLFP